MIPMLIVLAFFAYGGIRGRREWIRAKAEMEEERTDRMIWDADPLLARELGIPNPYPPMPRGGSGQSPLDRGMPT